MSLNKEHQYVYRIGSDHQHRLHWDGKSWVYEFLAGGVLFDEQKLKTEQELSEAIGMHGMTFDQFEVDESGSAKAYSEEILEKIKKLQAAGIEPCAKHGLSAKNEDNTCEACDNDAYPDDYKGSEGS